MLSPVAVLTIVMFAMVSVWLWDADSQEVARKFDGSAAAPILGQTATTSPLLSAVMSRTSPWLQVAFSTDLASVLFSYR